MQFYDQTMSVDADLGIQKVHYLLLEKRTYSLKREQYCSIARVEKLFGVL